MNVPPAAAVFTTPFPVVALATVEQVLAAVVADDLVVDAKVRHVSSSSLSMHHWQRWVTKSSIPAQQVGQNWTGRMPM